MRRAALLAGVFALATAARVAAVDVPAWLLAASAEAMPAYDKKVPAVVLVDEGDLTVEASGRLRRVARFAVKVLNDDGRAAAAVTVDYGTEARKVVSLEAWRVPVDGKVKKYGKAETSDVALSGDDVYNEARGKVVSASGDVETGDIFAFEAVTEERPLFAQDIWYFQHRYPVRASRYTLSLPAGWRAEGRLFNHAAVAPSVAGTQYTWQLRDLPYIGREPLGPPVTLLAPRLAVSYFPADGGEPSGLSSFAGWADVSRWYTGLSAPQAELDEALRARARELTRDARTDLDRVRAIARYVQAINYISVQMGIGRYRPHAAADVLAKAYGDCKDKANLMRALLDALGLRSHLVLVYSGDPTFVRDEWASPSQFNHCILAVRLPGNDALGAILDDRELGRLLFFDPTDPDTMLGDLPEPQQGSWALVAAGDGGRLVTLPKPGPQSKAIDRRVDAKLTPEGTLTATVREASMGQAAVSDRRLFRGPRDVLARRLDAWATRGAASAKVGAFRHEDDPATGRLAVDLELEVPLYAQLMQQRLLVFRPVILDRREWVFPAQEEPRTQPMTLEDHAFSESLNVALPSGFAVDELPEPVVLESAFGTYTSRTEVAGDRLSFTRRLEIRRSTLPVEQHAAVRGFFEKVRAAERAQVVLVRTN